MKRSEFIEQWADEIYYELPQNYDAAKQLIKAIIAAYELEREVFD